MKFIAAGLIRDTGVVMAEQPDELPLRRFYSQLHQPAQEVQMGQEEKVFGQDYFYLNRFFYCVMAYLLPCIVISVIGLRANITTANQYSFIPVRLSPLFVQYTVNNMLIWSISFTVVGLAFILPCLVNVFYYHSARKQPRNILLVSKELNPESQLLKGKKYDFAQLYPVLGYRYSEALRQLEDMAFEPNQPIKRKLKIISLMRELEDLVRNQYIQLTKNEQLKKSHMMVYEFYNQSEAQLIRARAQQLGELKNSRNYGRWLANNKVSPLPTDSSNLPINQHTHQLNQANVLAPQSHQPIRQSLFRQAGGIVYQRVPQPHQIFFQFLIPRNKQMLLALSMFFALVPIIHICLLLLLIQFLPSGFVQCKKTNSVACKCLADGLFQSLATKTCDSMLLDLFLMQFLGIITGIVNIMAGTLGINILRSLYRRSNVWYAVDYVNNLNIISTLYLFYVSVLIPFVLSTPFQNSSLAIQLKALIGNDFLLMAPDAYDLKYAYTNVAFNFGQLIAILVLGLYLAYNEWITVQHAPPEFYSQIAFSTVSVCLFLVNAFFFPLSLAFVLLSVLLFFLRAKIKLAKFKSRINFPDNIIQLNFGTIAVAGLFSTLIFIELVINLFPDFKTPPYRINFNINFLAMPLYYIIPLFGVICVLLSAFVYYIQLNFSTVSPQQPIYLTVAQYLPFEDYCYRGYYYIISKLKQAQVVFQRIENPNLHQQINNQKVQKKQQREKSPFSVVPEQEQSGLRLNRTAQERRQQLKKKVFQSRDVPAAL